MVQSNTLRLALAHACSPYALGVVLAGIGLWVAPANAQTTINLNLGSVVANGSPGLADDATTNTPDSAAAKAPSRTPFNATQPTSVVSRQYIANSVSPTGNYDDAIKFDPSVANVEPDGPGLQESKSIEIRGFQDGQYNILYDGIPLAGAPTDYHHESAAYFTDNDLGEVEIDRGPGTAATIGDATFGGTLSLYSKDPQSVMTGTAYASYGSFATEQTGAEFDTGAISSLNGAAGFFDIQHDSSNGYLSYSGDHRLNYFGKWLQPVNADTVLTFEAMHNEGFQYTPSGATPQQIAEYGPNFGNNDNPKSQAFYEDQQNKYATDFEYIGLATKLPYGISFDNKVYTDAFYHDTFEATDPSGLTANISGKIYEDGGATATTVTNNVPGKSGLQDYRAYGNVARFDAPLLGGQYAHLKFGLWYDHTANAYSSDSVDMTLGGVPYSTKKNTSPYSYNLDDFADTIQPYAELDLTPLPGLTLMPGVKYTYYSRLDDALINKTTKLPGEDQSTYHDVEPSFEARYILLQGLSVYGQVAKGFQGPPLTDLFATEPTAIQPERTWNYQVGAVYQTHDTDISADLYYIDFDNFYQNNTVTIGGVKQSVYTDGGGVIYKGAEIEATQNVFGPISLYGNFTLNDAIYTSNGQAVAQSPRRTMAAGAIFEQGPFYASIIGKYVGPQYGQDTTAGRPTDEYPIKTYSNVDLAADYALPPLKNGGEVKLKLNANNLLNDTQPVQLAGLAGDGVTPMYFTDPGFSIFVSIAVSFR